MGFYQLQHRCPHCSEHKDFVIQQPTEMREVSAANRHPPLWEPMATPNSKMVKAEFAIEFCGLSRCPLCLNPVLFILAAARGFVNRATQHSAHSQNFRLEGPCQVIAVYPEAPRIDAHPSWPEEIKQPFVEMLEDVRRNRTPAFIITNCRTILDVATKHLGGEGKSIFDRIEDLRAKGLLTGSLADWAHRIRQRGADAVHDLVGDAETARQLVEFIRLFLHVAYELPEMIREKRPDTEQ